MMIFRKFALLLFTAALSSYTYADIIELDAISPDHCRQQILQSSDEIPVIAAFTSNPNNENSKLFMEKFELLAKNHPERTFFKWDAEKDKLHLTQTLCLQQIGISVQPSIILVGVFKADIDNVNETFMSSPLRLSWAGEMTMAEMNKFIDVSDQNINKSSLKNKFKF